MDCTHYITFSRVFRYPGASFREHVRDCYEMLSDKYPEIAGQFALFSSWIESHNDERVEELYTKTFDVQPVTFLDIGYVLFVEDYKRGEFLVHMKGEQDRAGNDYETDLPDNLVHMLTLLPKMENGEFREELVVRAIIPALRKMLDEFKEARVELKLKTIKKLHRALIDEELNHGNVYRYAITSLLMVLETDFSEAHKRFPPLTEIGSHAQNNFLKKGQPELNT